jgi:NADH-quinone oxidoreductase subunit E
MGMIHSPEPVRIRKDSPPEEQISQTAAEVDQIITRHGFQESSLIAILTDIQAHLNFLPQKALTRVAKSLDIPLTRVYAVATFYKAFSLEPRGRHTIKVCLGTACHVRGGARILNYVQNRLGVTSGGTTRDLRFSLESVNCLGACALGPMIVVDGDHHGRIKTNAIESILKRYE